MTDLPLSGLTAATFADRDDPIYLVRGGASRQITKRNFLGTGDVANLLDWTGADPTGINDNASILTAALAQSLTVFVPPGNWVMDNSASFELSDYHTLIGDCPARGAETTDTSGYSRLIMSGDATAAFVNEDAATRLLHAFVGNLAIYVTGSYTWLFDLKEILGFRLYDNDIYASGTSTGLFRTQKISSSSWANLIESNRFRVPDASTARTLDCDFGDTVITGNSFTGGLGAIFRGTGGNRIIGNRFDRTTASGAGLRVSIETSSGAQNQIVANQIELNAGYDIYVDGDAGGLPTGDHVGLVIADNMFRSSSPTASIHLERTSGSALTGVSITGNTWNAAASVNAITYDATYWANITTAPNTFYNKDYGFIRLGRTGSANELTIASGVIALRSGRHTIDTQGGASTDDLDTINGLADGEIAVISTENDARDVVVKHGTGNITLNNGADFAMTSTASMLGLMGTPSGVVELFRQGQAATTFTPTVSFATAGDFSATYTEQNGRGTIVGNVYHFSINLQFSSNAYTTASGVFQIDGLPFNPSLDEYGTSTPRIDGFDWGASDKAINAYITTSGLIQFWRAQDAAGGGAVTVAQVPASTSFVIWLSGSFQIA